MGNLQQSAGARSSSAIAGLLLAIGFWGASFIAIKLALRELSPAAIAASRNGLAAALLGLIVWRRGGLRPPSRRALPAVGLLGFLGTVFHQWLQMTGLLTASATVTSWIIATIPVFVALLGWLFLKEPLGGRRALGIALAAAGVLTVVSAGDPGRLLGGLAATRGDVLIVLSAVNWAVYTILSKRLIGAGEPGPSGSGQSAPTVTLLFYGYLAGFGLSLVWLAVDGGWRDLAGLTPTGWGAVGFLGVACSGLAYLFWYNGLALIDATQVGSFLYLEPLVTTALAAPLLGEPITASILLGGAAILVGVWRVTRS